MAWVKRQKNVEIRIVLDGPAFVSAQGVRLVEAVEDGTVVAERHVKVPMTLAQLKTLVAAL